MESGKGLSSGCERVGSVFPLRVVITPWRDSTGKPVGYLLISKDVANEVAFTKESRRAKLFDSAIVGNAQGAVDLLPTFWNRPRSIRSSARTSMERFSCGTKVRAGFTAMSRRKSSEGRTPRSCTYRRTSSRPAHARSCRPPCVNGKWEGTLPRVRKNGERFTARVVITPRTG